MRCDNGERTHLGQPIFTPACYRGEATTEVTINYHPGVDFDYDNDTLNLCDDCTRLAKKSARRSGYRVKTKPLEREHRKEYQ